jgi:hypothetical protein
VPDERTQLLACGSPRSPYPEYAAARNESSPGPDFRRSRAYRSCFASADRAWGIESSAVRNLSSDGPDILSFLVYGRIFLGIPCGCPLSLVRLIGKRSADRNPKHRQGRHCLFRYGPERAACGSLRHQSAQLRNVQSSNWFLRLRRLFKAQSNWA